jgi:hypothetical protein
VVTPVRDGFIPGELRTYRQRLSDVLEALQRRLDAGIPTPPSLLGTIHFARWFVIDNPPGPQPAAGETSLHPGWLVFTSNFDGDMLLYLRDFAQQIPEQMDLVWSNCEGYPAAGCADFDAFTRYVCEHQLKTLAFVVAYPDLTVADIGQLRALRSA